MNEDKVWNPVVSIPEGEVGTYAIKHTVKPPGTALTTANARCAFIGGQEAKRLIFQEETRWHSLVYEGGVWMTDLPCEQAQLDRHIPDMHGRVLVGGLGLGYAINRLAESDDVDEIVVVEIAPEVVALVSPHLWSRGKVRVVQQDLFEYLKRGEEFDSAFYDIWQLDGEAIFHGTVVPLRQASRGLIPDEQVVCWNEDVMRGQLSMALASRLQLIDDPEACAMFGTASPEETLEQLCTEQDDRAGGIYHNWAVPFFRAIRAGRIAESDRLTYAGVYAGQYGVGDFAREWEEEVLPGVRP